MSQWPGMNKTLCLEGGKIRGRSCFLSFPCLPHLFLIIYGAMLSLHMHFLVFVLVFRNEDAPTPFWSCGTLSLSSHTGNGDRNTPVNESVESGQLSFEWGTLDVASDSSPQWVPWSFFYSHPSSQEGIDLDCLPGTGYGMKSCSVIPSSAS